MFESLLAKLPELLKGGETDLGRLFETELQQFEVSFTKPAVVKSVNLHNGSFDVNFGKRLVTIAGVFEIQLKEGTELKTPAVTLFLDPTITMLLDTNGILEIKGIAVKGPFSLRPKLTQVLFKGDHLEVKVGIITQTIALPKL